MKLSTDPHVLKVTAGLALAGLILFGASFNDPFHFDDILILNDANVTNAERWHHFVNPLHLRQITFFTFYLNYLAGGDSPAGFHIVNVLLHIANAALLFCLVARFTERWIAIAAALVFLVHPIQTESVLYVYQRSILLACFFSLLGTIAVVEKRPWLAVLLFLCAFESKESSIAVPLVVAALREARARQREASSDDRRLSAVIDRRYRLALVVGAIILAVAALFLLAYQNEGTVGLGAADEVSPLSYARTQTRVFYTYIRLLFFPYPQSLEYEFPRDTSILPLLGLFVIAGGAWWLLRNEHWRLPALCVFAFFILLAPTSSIVPSVDAAFEHRLYLPMLAFAVFAAVLIGRLPHRSAIGVPLLLVLGVLTIYRGTVWSS
ncbi:MAG: hypothetical protein HY646_19530, partial [Acidobacteria bacterium]|nr:hypothetical protein [Acidobacteriota bacterium]